MRLGRLRYLIVVAFLLAVAWLAYWIGYISSKPSSYEKLLQHEEGLHNDILVNAMRQVNNNSHIIVLNKGLTNLVKNKLDDVDKNYAQRIHMLHVAQINDHLHAPEKTTKFVNKTPKHILLQEESKDGIEWQHFNQHKKFRLNNTEEAVAVAAPTQRTKAPEPVLFDPNDPYYALIHAQLANKVHGKIHEKLSSLPDTVPKDAYIFETDK